MRELRAYALRGVQIEIADVNRRLQELKGLRQQLLKGTQSNGKTAVAERGRQRRKMSAAARKAVSERMRKYWSDRRKSESAKAK